MPVNYRRGCDPRQQYQQQQLEETTSSAALAAFTLGMGVSLFRRVKFSTAHVAEYSAVAWYVSAPLTKAEFVFNAGGLYLCTASAAKDVVLMYPRSTVIAR